jgi:murein L,D-transpeptidase YcbB/YkuD
MAPRFDIHQRKWGARSFAVLTAALGIALLWHGTPASEPAVSCLGDRQAVAICETLNTQPTLPGIDLRQFSQLRALYADRQYRPAWSGTPEMDARTTEVLSTLQHADTDGLEPADYRVGPEISGDPRQIARRDLLISDAVLRYAHDLRVGRVPADSSDADVELPSESFDLLTQFEASLRDGTVATFLSEQRPPQQEYDDLRNALEQYRARLSRGAWEALPRPPSSWQHDESYLRRLRSRLALEDPFVSPVRGPDDAMEWAAIADSIRLFQQRNGLAADGKLGRRTLAALNIPPSQRVEQIVANMERWRWMPRAFEDRYVVVNVPQNELRVIDHGTTILRSRVIVGRISDPTPILRATARGLLINPPWNVPAIIARREILPKLQKDPFYLVKQDMILRDGPRGDPHGVHVNWRRLKTIPYAVQQLAGPKSALGQIKLDMPNRFDVYLHDTPGRAAFQLDERFLSHGCIRVQAILALASIVQTGEIEPATTSTQSMIDLGVTQRVAAASPMPVYLVYWTAFSDDDGQVSFRPDIYGRDERLIAQLGGKRSVRVTSAAVACCVG